MAHQFKIKWCLRTPDTIKIIFQHPDMTSRQKWHALVEIAHFFDKECDAQITRWENTDPDVPDIDRYVVILVDNKIVMLNMNWLSMTVIDCGAPV